MGNPQKHKEIIEVGKPKMQEAKMKTAKDPEMSIDWGDLDDLISPEPMEVDFELIEKTKKAARDPLEDFPDQKISGLGNLKIQVIDEGENDPHAPPD